MSDCKKCQDHMLEALYGELDPADREAFERHLGACPDCAAERAALAETLRTMDRRERSGPGPAFWDGYWDRLSRRMLWETTGEGRRPSAAGWFGRIGRLFPRLPRWVPQAAGAAALLVVGILIGSRVLGPGPGARTAILADGGPAAAAAAGPVVAAGAPSPAAVQAADFVDRSKVLLLGLVNFDPATQDAYAFDLDGKKAASRALLAQAPDIRRGLSGEPGQRRLRELVADLEVLMIQIANLEAGQDLEGVELVKQGVDRKGLFLKIDLDRMGRDAAGRAAAGRPVDRKKSQV